MGIKPENIFIEDLREEFVRDYVFPMFRANALYEGQYLLAHFDRAGRSLQEADRDRRKKVGADAGSPMGATGKGQRTRCGSSSPITR